MKKYLIKISAVFLAVLIFFSTLILPTAAATEEIPDDIETSDVISDLEVMGFDIEDYPKDTSAEHVRLLKFLEFGYDHGGDQSEYGIYIYVWNPTGTAINTESVLNKITIQSRAVTNLEQSAWRKLPLEFIDYSDAEGYEKVFYKFRVRGTAAKYLLQNVSRDLRVYEVSEIELHQAGNTNATSFTVGGCFNYTGFQPYHNSLRNAVNTLKSFGTKRTVIEIEINPTTWKTDTSAKGVGYANELFSVYFAIPNDIIRDYGNPADTTTKGLVQIDGQYDRHMINGLVVNNEELYDFIYPHLGVTVPSGDVPFNFYSDCLFVSNTGDEGSAKFYTYKDPFNIEMGTETGFMSVIYKSVITTGDRANKEIKLLTSALQADISDEKDFISDSALKDTLYAIWADKGELYYERSSNFVNSTGRIFGDELSYRVTSKDSNGDDVDLADQIEVYSSNHRPTIWQKYFSNSLFEEGDYENIKSIQVVNSSDLLTDSGVLKSESFSDKYYISERDIASLASFATSSELKGKITYLMRFAVEDYYATEVDIVRTGIDGVSGDGIYFEKVIYKNIDILSFTFEDEYSERVVLPVAATPVDNVGEITPTIKPNGNVTVNDDNADDINKWWEDIRFGVLLLAGILLIVFFNWLLNLLGLSLPKIVSGIFKILLLPFKALGKVVSTTVKAVDKSHEYEDRKRRHRIEDEDRKRKNRAEDEDRAYVKLKRAWEGEDRGYTRKKRSQEDEDRTRKRIIESEDRVYKRAEHNWKQESHNIALERHSWSRKDRKAREQKIKVKNKDEKK